MFKNILQIDGRIFTEHDIEELKHQMGEKDFQITQLEKEIKNKNFMIKEIKKVTQL